METPKQITEPGRLTNSPPVTSLETDALRERVAELDRLASIGQLTAGILHEIKNPLNFIINYARLSVDLVEEVESILPQFNDHPEVDELNAVLIILKGNIVRIRENGTRAERIMQGMLAQTRADSSVFELTDLNTLIEEFTKLAYQGVRAGDNAFVVSLDFDLDPTVGQIMIAPYEFNRVILNLVINACYAVDERRKRESDAYKPIISLFTQRYDDHLEIKIRDNGEGIPDGVKQKLFTPFFTTKPVGVGTGLGLALSRNIVHELHGGTLSVESEANNFTEFTISLPLEAKQESK
ncbi:two-component sensor histidine kinase [Spirosoma agri]|uniref:histidine kinase n=1 Tax=Spirosoma agri TaxID=1987381 RepID=A0A6M0IRL1_9BACT|nr:ATP-binding protein [Spirosoma agri]NEU70011.1 two-component sensor histidine kinase [Spirosoma agri]